jgi:hypothetical protein
MNTLPQATYPLEYIAVFDFQLTTKEGPVFVFMAVDAFSQFAFHLNVERDKRPETILKNIYFLIEQEEFARHLEKEFTLVLSEYEEFSDRIEAIIKPVKGKVLFNRSFNNYLSNPILKSMRDSLVHQKKKP